MRVAGIARNCWEGGRVLGGQRAKQIVLVYLTTHLYTRSVAVW
jgi:hypothetical protein